MDTREAVGIQGLPSRALLLLVWGLLLVQVAMNARSVIPSMEVAAGGAADFSIFYTGAGILRAGWRHELYNLDVQARFQSSYYRDRPLPYNHAAYELLLFLPLAGREFSTQYYSWLAVNLFVLLWIAVALSKAFDHPYLKRGVLLLSAALAFPPLAICLLQGQDTLLLLLIYALTYRDLQERRDFTAGLLLSLGLFKFQLVVPFLIPMAVRRYWTFLQGFVVGAVALAATSIVITGFGGFLKYVELLRLLTQRPEIGYITPALMPNLRGLLAILVQGTAAAGLLVILLSAIALGIAARMMPLPSIRDHRFDAGFAVSVTAVILASYHLYLHDLTLALLPILIGANRLHETTAKVLFWSATTALFLMPIYAWAGTHRLRGLLSVCVILLSAGLRLGWPTATPRFPECAA